MDAATRGRVAPAIDPRAVVALVPKVIIFALDTRVRGHLLAERVGVAAPRGTATAAPGLVAAVVGENFVGVLDARRFIAFAADLVFVLERELRAGDRRRCLERAVA